jgi:hypothetical protein
MQGDAAKGRQKQHSWQPAGNLVWYSRQIHVTRIEPRQPLSKFDYHRLPQSQSRPGARASSRVPS